MLGCGHTVLMHYFYKKNCLFYFWAYYKSDKLSLHYDEEGMMCQNCKFMTPEAGVFMLDEAILSTYLICITCLRLTIDQTN